MNDLKDIVFQLEYCDFSCDGGMLKNNTSFRVLKNYANDNYALIKSPCELHRDFVGELCPVCMSNELIRAQAENDAYRRDIVRLNGRIAEMNAALIAIETIAVSRIDREIFDIARSARGKRDIDNG
jgi:hypothetical protein